ncbi:transcription factor WhiB [Kitasatospora sp. NPDC057692]|uniref:transcription factor WhiB n=1 Tax=Kitasatospora sp. NPDC057692 TaxID=3346215 RepID=UPI00367E9204
MTGWLGGLTIRTGPGPPTADYLCTHCWYHQRLTGHDRIRYGARDLPLTHRATCPALHPKGTTP